MSGKYNKSKQINASLPGDKHVEVFRDGKWTQLHLRKRVDRTAGNNLVGSWWAVGTTESFQSDDLNRLYLQNLLRIIEAPDTQRPAGKICALKSAIRRFPLQGNGRYTFKCFFLVSTALSPSCISKKAVAMGSVRADDEELAKACAESIGNQLSIEYDCLEVTISSEDDFEYSRERHLKKHGPVSDKVKRQYRRWYGNDRRVVNY